MALIKYKNPTEYSFYKWIKSYPNSEYWIERIKKCPNLKLSPLIETQEFYKFVKTACKNRALNWLDWNKIEKIVLKEIPILNSNDLSELENIFKHLVNFYKTPAISFGAETWSETKKEICIERWFAKGEFHEKEVPINIQKGGIAVLRRRK